MSWFQVIDLTSEKQGARKLLEAMTQLPPVPQALQILDNQDANILRVGDWLQNRILAAFREEEERSEGLQRDLKYQALQAASLQSILETYSSDPLEQKSRAAEKAREAAEQQLCETQRELSAATERHEQELAAKAQELQALRTQNAELKQLVAKQHGQLSDLFGSEPPK